MKAKISARQFTILIVLGTIGDSMLILPTIIAQSAGEDSWLAMLAAVPLGVIVVGGLFAMIADRLGGRSPVEAAVARWGIWAGGFVGLLFLVEFFLGSVTLLSEVSQFMTTQMMPETPDGAIIILFLAVLALAYRYGVESFARMGEILFPFFFVFFAFLVVFLFPQAEFDNLKPIAARGIEKIGYSVLLAFTILFTEMNVLLMLSPSVESKGKLIKPILKGFAFGGGVMFIVVLMCILVLGPDLMETKFYPAFVLAQKISIGHFLERLEAILAFLWIVTVFYKSLLLFYSLTSGTAQLLRLKESGMLTIPLAMILLVFTKANMPSVILYNKIIRENYPWFDLTFCLVLPALFLAGLLVAGGREKKETASGEMR